MRIHAPQIGEHQYVGAQLGVALRYSQRLKYRGYRGLQVFAFYEFCFVVTYFELLQHG